MQVFLIERHKAETTPLCGDQNSDATVDLSTEGSSIEISRVALYQIKDTVTVLCLHIV